MKFSVFSKSPFFVLWILFIFHCLLVWVTLLCCAGYFPCRSLSLKITYQVDMVLMLLRSWGWLWIECLTLMPPHCKCWDHGHIPPHSFLEINFNWPVGLFSSKFSLSLENIVMAHLRGPNKLAFKSLQISRYNKHPALPDILSLRGNSVESTNFRSWAPNNSAFFFFCLFKDMILRQNYVD